MMHEKDVEDVSTISGVAEKKGVQNKKALKYTWPNAPGYSDSLKKKKKEPREEACISFGPSPYISKDLCWDFPSHSFFCTDIRTRKRYVKWKFACTKGCVGYIVLIGNKFLLTVCSGGQPSNQNCRATLNFQVIARSGGDKSTIVRRHPSKTS